MTMPDDQSSRTRRRRARVQYESEGQQGESSARDEAEGSSLAVDEGDGDGNGDGIGNGGGVAGMRAELRAALRSELRGAIPFPLLNVSGLYSWSQKLGPLPQPPHPLPIDPPIPLPGPFPGPLPGPGPTPIRGGATDGDLETMMETSTDGAAATDGSALTPVLPVLILNETLRLDVDGRFPLQVASGTLFRFLTERTHWVARLTRQPDGSWTGPIFYKDGDTSSFPFTSVRITAVRSPFPAGRTATVHFLGAGTSRVRTYRWSSAYHHPCEVEFDTVVNATAVTSIDTHAHPNRPASLPQETLTIEKVYQRAGFNVTRGADNPIPITGAGVDALWSTAEMHDAMQKYWSRFADKAQWAVWTLFARLSDSGTSLGGIMFDSVGTRQRQGTAVFSDSFIATPPANDPAPAAWVRRMRFWTTAHELGHTFNLAHSWQKQHPASWGTSWVPLVNEPQARSFMNYPYNVTGGQAAFFASFEYRFSDQELLFLRHAPERFVQQGNAAWFTNHGFSQVRASASPTFAFELRSNQGDQPVASEVTHRFMDQVMIELKLTNITDEPQIVDAHLLEALDRVTLVVKREGGDAKLWAPYATMCWHGTRQVLMPGQSVYAPVYLSAGRDGFYVAEPGRYVVQAAIHLPEEDIVSNAMRLRVLPPRDYEEAAFAQDLFTSDVGRVFAFDGSHALANANATLRQAADRFPDHPLATHALVALAMPDTRPFRELQADSSSRSLRFHGEEAQPDQARVLLEQAITDQPEASARTLGHIDFGEYGTRFASFLAGAGEQKAADNVRDTVVDTLAARGVGKPILDKLRKAAK